MRLVEPQGTDWNLLQIERTLPVLPIDRLELSLRRHAEEGVEGGTLSFGSFERRYEIKDLMVFLGPSVGEGKLSVRKGRTRSRSLRKDASEQCHKGEHREELHRGRCVGREGPRVVHSTLLYPTLLYSTLLAVVFDRNAGFHAPATETRALLLASCCEHLFSLFWLGESSSCRRSSRRQPCPPMHAASSYLHHLPRCQMCRAFHPQNRRTPVTMPTLIRSKDRARNQKRESTASQG